MIRLSLAGLEYPKTLVDEVPGVVGVAIRVFDFASRRFQVGKGKI
jgi:hypothetical protein